MIYERTTKRNSKPAIPGDNSFAHKKQLYDEWLRNNKRCYEILSELMVTIKEEDREAISYGLKVLDQDDAILRSWYPEEPKLPSKVLKIR